MQLAKALSISLYGLAGRIIEVEADISSNLPAFVLVGLPDASVNEAASRVRAATTNSKLALPGRRITVNLSPASVPKQGSSFDLAIAMAALAAANQVNKHQVEKTLFLGELALDGSIKPINGILAALIACTAVAQFGVAACALAVWWGRDTLMPRPVRPNRAAAIPKCQALFMLHPLCKLPNPQEVR